MRVYFVLWQVTLVLFILKLTEHIHWGWFWVISPILLPIIIFLFLVTHYLFVGGGGDDAE